MSAVVSHDVLLRVKEDGSGPWVVRVVVYGRRSNERPVLKQSQIAGGLEWTHAARR